MTTYAASVTNLATATTATDIVTISGSATKTVRITRVSISGIATSAQSQDILLIKRSSANTGGTSAAPTAVPLDSNSGTATASLLQYTANPTALGTAVGTIYTRRLFFSPVTGGATSTETEVLWDTARPAQTVVLRGTSQFLAVNLNATTIAGSAVNINIEWTEE